MSATSLRQLRVFISSPSDLADERVTVSQIVEEVSRTVAARHSAIITSFRWEQDAVPVVGPPPQETIDRQSPMEDVDIFVGLVWKRMGTPTTRHGSGTESEFRDAYKNWRSMRRPRILFYFKESPYVLTTDDEVRQLSQVLAFKSDVSRLGLVRSFASMDDLSGMLREHLVATVYDLLLGPTHVSKTLLVAARLTSPSVLEKRDFLWSVLTSTVRDAVGNVGEMVQRLMRREALGDTRVLGNRLAVPHVSGTGRNADILLLVHVPSGVLWGRGDGHVTHVLIAMFASQGGSGLITFLSDVLSSLVEDEASASSHAPPAEYFRECLAGLSASLTSHGRDVEIVNSEIAITGA